MTHYAEQQYALPRTPQPTPRKPRWWPWAVALVVSNTATAGIVLAATNDTATSGTSRNPLLAQTGTQLRQAHRECGTGSLDDGDHTLEIDMAGEEPGSGTATFADFDCALTHLDAPRSVIAQMESTRALDGRQTATWGDFEASWTYHPDDGLDVIITQR